MPKKYERDPKSGSDLLIGQMVVRPPSSVSVFRRCFCRPRLGRSTDAHAPAQQPPTCVRARVDALVTLL